MTIQRLLAAILAAALAVPLAAQAQTPSLRGTVTYAGTEAPPAGAVLRVELLGANQANAQPATLIQQNIDIGGRRPPFDFDLRYNPVSIVPGGTYTVRAQVTLQNVTIYNTPNPVRVLTGGAPTTATVTITRTSSALPNTSGGAAPLLLGLTLLVIAAAIYLLRRRFAPPRP